MKYEDYQAHLAAFENGQFESIAQSYDEICAAQDLLIRQLVEAGASIKGWKVVEDSGLIIISPIFDFQLFSSAGEELASQPLDGIEIEIAYLCRVPDVEQRIEEQVKLAEPRVAVEVMRPKINSANYQSCDFYYNYGIVVAEETLQDAHFSLQAGNKERFDYSTLDADFYPSKQALLREGMMECVRRGYTEQEYYFMTGSLNGVLDLNICTGHNQLIAEGKTYLELTIN
ncbi:hypothetical protein [Marinomonas epiphytica]